MAEVITGCNHTHSVALRLTPEEQWVQPARWKDGKPVLITLVTASCEAAEMPTEASLGGWYAKKDGAASKTRTSWPERVKVGVLPDAIQAQLRAAFVGQRHG